MEYCSQIWSPVKISDIELLESVQRNFTKRLPNLKHLSYSDRLRLLKLRSLEERRLLLDLIFCFNTLHGFNNLNPSDIGFVVSSLSTRGNSLKLSILHSNVTPRANFISCRIAPVWNYLPDEVVQCTKPCQFKRKLHLLDFSNFLVQTLELFQYFFLCLLHTFLKLYVFGLLNQRFLHFTSYASCVCKLPPVQILFYICSFNY